MLLRSILFNAIFFPATALLTILVTPLVFGPPRWILWCQAKWAWGVVWLLRCVCGIHLRIEGREHLPQGGAALLASKHQSAFDTIIWLGLLPAPAYVMKRELFAIPFYGWLSRASGMIGVDRGAGPSAMRGLMRDGRAAAKAGRQVVIFPEGTRMAPGMTVPFQPGVAALAAVMKLPVIPVATNSGLCWSRRSFFKRRGTIVLRILEPISAGLPREALLTELRTRIATAQHELEA
jgi:1-acyl-sn-glycerol-3-phosphate acyltransferase